MKITQAEQMKARLIVLIGAILILIASFFIAPKIFALIKSGTEKQLASALGATSTTTKVGQEEDSLKNGVKHLPTPEPLKAIYMSSCVVGTKDFRASLVKIADTTEVKIFAGITFKKYLCYCSCDCISRSAFYKTSPRACC
jgi:hypothetical protein